MASWASRSESERENFVWWLRSTLSEERIWTIQLLLAWRDGDPDAADSVPLNMGAFLRSFFFIPGECCI